MATIKDVMTRDPAVIGPRSSLEAALELMQEKKVRHLPVINIKGAPVGMISQRDIVLGMGLQHHAEGLVEDVMSPSLLVVAEDTVLEQIVTHMRRMKLSAAVVVDDLGRVSGIFTISDVLAVLAKLTKKMA